MRYPKDTSLGASAEEIVNCRCTVRYVGKGETELAKSALLNTEHYYKPVVRGADSKNVTINHVSKKRIDIRSVEAYAGNVFISDAANIKPKALHQIYQNTIEAMRKYGLSESQLPRIVIVSYEELGAYGKYDAATNTVYYIPEIVKENNELKFGDTEYHEMWHFKQAADYRKSGKDITLENKIDYLRALCGLCKKRIDRLGINRYNVGEISDYAKIMYERGRYDEVEAEYARLKRKKV